MTDTAERSGTGNPAPTGDQVYVLVADPAAGGVWTTGPVLAGDRRGAVVPAGLTVRRCPRLARKPGEGSVARGYSGTSVLWAPSVAAW
jgi:hypothetical protein